jgi:hypothetical protein
VSVAFVLAQTFLFNGLPQPFTAFALSATAITFWYGGTKLGILAALISWLVRDHFFKPEVSPESRILYGVVFLFSALVMILTMRGREPWGSPGGRLKTSIFGGSGQRPPEVGSL